VYLPLHWKTPRPVPPLKNHLPIYAVAHKTIPFTHGLSKMPMINSHLVSSAPTILPRSLMDNTYSALKMRVTEALLAEWPDLLPTPGYYHHLTALNSRPFMGLGMFIAGRIYQMRAGKSYLAAHPTWRSPDPDTSCPRCGLEPEAFEHTILTCPSTQGARSRLLYVFRVSARTPLFGPPSAWSKGSPPSSEPPPPDSPLRCFRQTLPLPHPPCPSHP